MYIYFCDMEYKECLIENTFFPYRLYGYIHASGYGYTVGHSDHSAFTAQILLAALLKINVFLQQQLL